MTTPYKYTAIIDFDDSTYRKSDGGIYTAVAFNVLDPKYYSLLAVVRSNRV